MASGGGVGSSSEPPIRRVLLTDAGRRTVESTFVKDTAAGEAEKGGAAEVLYDTKALYLTRSGARLAQRSGAWELTAKPGCELKLDGAEPPLTVPAASPSYDTVQRVQDIASRLGIALSNGASDDPKAFPFELAKAGLRPLARWRVDRSSFRAPLPGGAPANSRGVVIDLEFMHFDTICAEPAAVAEMLSRNAEAEAPRELGCVFAEFRVSGGQGSRWEVDDFMRGHRLDTQGGGSVPQRSALSAYLRACRPTHLFNLAEAGVELEPPEEAREDTGPPSWLEAARESSDAELSEEDDNVYRI